METATIKKFEAREQILETLQKDRELAGADMSGLDLSCIKLMAANLFGADLHNSNLANAKIVFTDMSNVNLANANLEDAWIGGTSLRDANLRGAHMSAAKVTAVHMHDADLTGADLSDSRLIAVDVTGADFTDAKMENATALVEWKDAKVQPADLPEPIKPPHWLPFVFAAVVGLGVFLILRRRNAAIATPTIRSKKQNKPFRTI